MLTIKRQQITTKDQVVEKPIINAFKTNALFQIKDITTDEAKQTYIELVNNYFLYRK